ncbi:kinetochore protein Mis13 [Schizosaccharomyces cryophilus OY26]|uniref:Kinetochore protein Mis13 n=1 Tax=Schizosaccharomyces cryophilus (strain OY26 / ATCC MYA-4695 / CBS 11777 / NBRC 106824 / NRRL Y48691) TaxID=653667 RepID=S9VN60_SCHCR|nr:kinetochore protein Mis13 [Schizosaccharomyces cryophilus OY26]EPY49368.1 kinetochore protein Mis13 [Schizosaccharomyces cryophilus OY26]
MKRKQEVQEGFTFVRKGKETTSVKHGKSDTSQNEESPKSEKMIALPVSDTPIIKKNQKLRKSKGRRSSLDQRGKRASSIGTGFEALPHADVPTDEYYRHISKDLSEPLRMKQLLLWASYKRLDEQREKYKETKESSEAAIARSIIQEVLNELLSNQFSISWYQRSPNEIIPNKPHPQNLKNIQLLDELTAKLAQLQDEEAAWRAVAAGSVENEKTLHACRDLSNRLSSSTDSTSNDQETSKEMNNYNQSYVKDLKMSLNPLLDSLSQHIHALHSLTRISPSVRSAFGERAAHNYLLHKQKFSKTANHSDTMNLLRILSKSVYQSQRNNEP